MLTPLTKILGRLVSLIRTVRASLSAAASDCLSDSLASLKPVINAFAAPMIMGIAIASRAITTITVVTRFFLLSDSRLARSAALAMDSAASARALASAASRSAFLAFCSAFAFSCSAYSEG